MTVQQADLKTFRCDGLDFEYIEHGPPDGEPVVLLHGFPQHAGTWQQTSALLAAAGYRTLALDQRGYSPDARPRRIQDYRLTELASDGIAFIREVADGRAHLVGHDLGAEVAWVIAATAPSLTQSLTAVSTPHPRALTRAFVTSGQAIHSWYILFLQLPILPEVAFRAGHGAVAVRLLQRTGLKMPWVREYVDRLLVSRSALRGAIDWYRAFPLTPRLVFASPPVTVPTLYVWGDDDSVVTRSAAERTSHYVTGPYDFHVLDGTSHWIPEEAPGPLAQLILAHAHAFPVSASPP
jgi:pimeloyl-ACP methyl ester carboxylesterase